MDNRVPMLLGALAGAITGAVCGYLYFTEDGRRLRADLGPTIDELSREWTNVRDAAGRARDAAHEGMASIRQMDEAIRADDFGFPR